MQGQWSVLRTFNSPVQSVYFLDQQNAAQTGFVGLSNSAIWRTSDDGAHWYQASTPNLPVPEEISDFAFKDSLVGWCAVRSAFATGEVWKTSDGGNSWDSCFAGGAFGSVAFCAASNMLVATCWTYAADMSITSTDFGTTWSAFAPAWLNGVTFSGSNGYIGNISAPNPLHSSDGGVTWNTVTTLQDETWSPHGIGGSSTFVAVAEKTRHFFRSTDGGATWTLAFTFPSNAPPTGCVLGTLANLFVQTQTRGFYYSSDGGSSWSQVCGPDNSTDTRFYAKGREVFAGDIGGTLWHTPNGSSEGQSSLFLPSPSLSFSGKRCTNYDSVLYFEFGAGCEFGTLDSVTITSTHGSFSVLNDSAPRTFSGLDSLILLYTPSASLRDTGKLSLKFSLLNGNTLDTTIALYGSAKGVFSYSGDSSIDTVFSCQTTDTTVELRNTSCDTLTLWNTSIAPNPSIQLLPFPLPYKIPPDDSVGIPITVSPGQTGVFRSELKFTVVAAGLPYTKDSIPVTLDILEGSEASFSVLQLSLLDICQPLDTIVSVLNSRCDSITVDRASLSDTSVFHLGLTAFPLPLAPGDELSLPIEVRPSSKGTFTTTLNLQYQGGGRRVDTSIVLVVRVLYDLPLAVVLPDSAISLGTASVPCEERSRWISFHNFLCADLSIKRMVWLTPNSEFWFDPLPLPVTLSSGGGIDSLLVHFQPNSSGPATSRLEVTLDLNGADFDTVLTVNAIGVLRYNDSILTPVLRYDSVAECLSSQRVAEIVDRTCDSVVVISATALGSTGYSASGVTFPLSLADGDTLRVPFELKPKAPGTASDAAIITLHDLRKDSVFFDTIQLSAYVIAGRHALALNSGSFSVPNIPPCGVQDSTLVISNRGCDDVIINDTALRGYPGVVFVPPLILPMTIPPDSSIVLAFELRPNRDTLEHSTFSFGGQNIDTSLDFSYAALPAPPTLTFALPRDLDFLTRPCVPVRKSFWIFNTGCSDASVDSVVLSQLPNASQFTSEGLRPLPAVLKPGDTLAWTVTFDPTANGDGRASLYIKGGALSHTFALTGGVVGTVPTARIELRASDGSAQCTGVAGSETSILAVLLDDIGDSTSLSTVTLSIEANWNLLTPLQFSPAPGWSVVNTNASNNGWFNIELRHDAGGAVASGTKLLEMACMISVADSAATGVELPQVQFNAGDSSYERCVLSSIPMSDTPVLFTERDTCGTPQLREGLESKLALKIVSVQPNPAPISGHAARMSISFWLGTSADVRCIVRDVIGRQYTNLDRAFSAGVHSAEIDVPTVAEGTYFIELQAENSFAHANVMIQSGAPPN